MAVFLDKHRQGIVTNIAEELDCGFDCFFNVKTNEIITIPNMSCVVDESEFKEAFGADLEKIEKQKANFIKIEALESFESFKIMELFVEQLTDEKFKTKLKGVLAENKPLRKFRDLIDDSDFRQDWFGFKQKEIEKKVERQLSVSNSNT